MNEVIAAILDGFLCVECEEVIDMTETGSPRFCRVCEKKELEKAMVERGITRLSKETT